ncbi:binding partner of ACD11 1 [Argentina anserina]|uniref:binding partner of ACD11 1 n=1 Tax=Argentina anserina TaxID=57926 RepID=UPI0021763ED0|nr:binding partner of ACD11 1 [Potentilla anserina]
MEVRTVKINNVSLSATDHDLREFFSFSGEIEYVEVHSHSEMSQVAYVTFKDASGADTSILLSGATIVDQPVTIELAAEYKLPAAVASTLPAASVNVNAGQANSAARKAEDVVSSMLAKGFILGKDTIGKAKAFDEKHKIYSTATATVATLDQKIGFTEKLSASTTMVNDKLKQMDERFQVSEKTKSAYSAAGQTVSTAGSALMSNRYILTGSAWAAGAYTRAAQTASEVSQKTKEKVLAEEDKNGNKAGSNQAEGSKAEGTQGGKAEGIQAEGIKAEVSQSEGNDAAAGSQAPGNKTEGIKEEDVKVESNKVEVRS